MSAIKKILLTASGKITEEPGYLHGFLLGTDGSNDPTVTFYDGISPIQGNEIVPTATYDASALGLNGVTLPDSFNRAVPFDDGLYCSITLAAGTAEVMVYYSEGI